MNKLTTVLAILLLSGCATSPTKPAADDYPGQFRQATELLEKRRYTDAEPILKSLTMKQPKHFGPWANLGLLYARTNRPVEAKAALENALERNDEDPIVHNQLGILYRQARDFSAARDAYEQALKLKPNYAEAHYNLAILYDAWLPSPNQAIGHYRQYQKLAGKLDDAERAKLLIWIKDLERRGGKTPQE